MRLAATRSGALRVAGRHNSAVCRPRAFQAWWTTISPARGSASPAPRGCSEPDRLGFLALSDRFRKTCGQVVNFRVAYLRGCLTCTWFFSKRGYHDISQAVVPESIYIVGYSQGTKTRDQAKRGGAGRSV